MQYDIYDIKRCAKGKLIKEDKDEIEKWIIIDTARLIAGGQHSASEALLTAASKAFGYFKGMADPRDNYASFMNDLKFVKIWTT